jgi:phosphoserine phosphatase
MPIGCTPKTTRRAVRGLLIALLAGFAVRAEAQADPLPSWNDGSAKSAIVAFVAGVTKAGGPEFVPPAERIAVFDNDGTLWPENPMPFELAFVIDEVRSEAPAHPEWKDQQPYKAVLEGDVPGLVSQGKTGIIELFMATHAGMTTDEFDTSVSDWVATAKHPRFDRRYIDLAYEPMLEVLGYLRANGFKTFIVSGGGAEFMRVFAEETYGIPPEQVIGTLNKVKFEMRDDKPVLTILPELAHWDDKEGKPVAIHQIIGRRPVAAFGNSDGDLQMLQLTTIGPGPSLGLIVHHTDAEREWAYDAQPKSSGKLVDALAEADRRGWIVVDMKKDWKKVYAFED